MQLFLTLLVKILAFRFTEMFCIIDLDCLPAERTAIMAKHLSLSERALVHEKSFAEIAKQLNRSATLFSVFALTLDFRWGFGIIDITYKECARDKPVDRTATCRLVRC